VSLDTHAESFASAVSTPSPWLTVNEAADRARCGPKLIYREVRAKRLRAAKVGGRRELRILPEWIDAWLLAQTTIQ
jgi:excisionase family DNA binding protein